VFGSQEPADDRRDIALIGVDFGVEMTHLLDRDFARKIGQSDAKARKSSEGIAADDRDCIVRWKVVAIIVERDEVKRVDETVGGIPGHNVHPLVH